MDRHSVRALYLTKGEILRISEQNHFNGEAVVIPMLHWDIRLAGYGLD